MLIDVRGTSFNNKGAEMMLLATIEQIRSSLPGSHFSMRALRPYASYQKRALLGLYQLLLIDRIPRISNIVGALIPKYVRRALGIVIERDLDVVLDASGYSLGDPWGPAIAKRTARAVLRWKNNGAKIIFLPQAYGPFCSKEIRSSLRTIIDNIDLMYVRDQTSLKYVSQVVGRRSNVRQSPDFTSLLPARHTDYSTKYRGRICIVPNIKMIEKTPPEVSSLYFSMLVNCMKILRNLKQDPFVLVHESVSDLNIANRIVSESSLSIEIVTKDDPLEIKAVIKSCSGMIGSRYHALVSALSQTVPVLAIGWSHKYSSLLEDYGIPEAMLSVDNPESSNKKIEMFASPDHRSYIRSVIKKQQIKEQKMATLMWKEIIELLKVDSQ